MKWGILLLIVLVGAAPTTQPRPRLVITEIMYDPTSPESDEKETEWIELKNFGEESVNLQGLMLTSGTTAELHAAKQKYVFRDISLAPGGYLVVGVGAAKCYEGFDLPPFGIYCDEARYAWLSNSTDSIALRDAKKNVIDEVVYANESPWPITRHGGSIQFICPPGENPQQANDDGKNWVASGVSNSDEFKGHGRGTPGNPIKEVTNAAKPNATTRPSASAKRSARK